MLRVLLLVLLFTGLHANINERMIDIYFGNGVWNDLDGAKEGQKN